ncbi:MAG: CRTAC1 family protein [Planctomycetaceae bacterium]
MPAVVLLLRRPEAVDVPQAEVQSALPQTRDLPPLQVPAMPFTDVTTAAGLDFVHENGADGEKLLPETMGGGGAFLDFDNDGDQDILCVNSAEWPWTEPSAESPPTMALYANDGSGHFSNVTAGSGLDVSFYGTGVACGDYDNDGLVDIYLSAVGSNHLFHNAGQGRFVDVTDSSGTAGPEQAWSTSCGWFDYDHDGDVDLFVCNYIEWSREKDLSMEFTLDGTLRAYGRPTDFRGDWPVLYRNDGDGKFTDVSAEAGIQTVNQDTGEPLAKSLGLTFADVNGDDWLDVVIANDTVQNLLFLNQQNGTFQESAAVTGVAFDNNGSARGAMGIDSACFRNSDSVGITIGNFANEMTALYVCQTPGAAVPVFRDEAVSNGLGPVTRVELTFGVMFADFDLDGRPDLFACNGHLEEDIQKVQASQHYAQPPQLLWNCGPDYDNEFMVAGPDQVGDDFLKPMVGRGASRADIDGDGDLDLLLLASGGAPRLLRNDQQTGHHWLRFRLIGTDCGTDAIGATIRLTMADGTQQVRIVMPTCSYQSQVELPLTFGLGAAAAIHNAEVRWPGGDFQPLPELTVDSLIKVRQSE